MLHAYCVRRAGEPGPDPDLPGINGAPVRLIEFGPLGLWVSEGEARPATAERLGEHDRVVRDALRTATPLPIRYGAGDFPSEAAAREALAARAEEFAGALARLAGRVEMGVRVDWERPAASPREGVGEPSSGAAPQGGRAYLEGRREALREREALRSAAEEALDRVLRQMALDDLPIERTLLPQPGTAGIVAHLVRREDVKSYCSAVDRAGDALPDLRITPTGPWAPYSFT